MIPVILAAGRGTRMGEVTTRIPKPLVPVAGVPMIERVLRGLSQHKFAEAVIVVGHLGRLVREHLGDGSGVGIRLRFVDQPVQEGTARALLLSRDIVGNEDVLLTFTDIFTDPSNYGRMRDTFYGEECFALGAVRQVDDPWRGAAVYLDEQRNVQRIVEKPQPGTSTTCWNSAGMYCFRAGVFAYLAAVRPSRRGEYEVTDAVSAMIDDQKRVKALELTGYWRDLASLEDVTAVEELTGSN